MSDEAIQEEIEMDKSIVRSILPAIVQYLLADKVLKEEDLSNKVIVMQKVKEHCGEIIPKIKVQTVTYYNFLDACKSEFKNNRPEAGIVMASVCVENMINLFYRDMLEVVHYLDKSEIDRVLTVLSIPDKIGWFLKIAFELELAEDLVKQILELNSLRNKIVHFKATPDDGLDIENGSYSQIKQGAKTYTMEQLEILINSLDDKFEKARFEADHSYRIAVETVDKIL